MSYEYDKAYIHVELIFASDLGEIQTPNLLSRNQVLYSVKLRGLNTVNQ